jgi:hypothetical protein
MESERESMLGSGIQKELKQLTTLKNVDETGDSYSTGTEIAPEILQVVENKGWLPGRGFEPQYTDPKA